jgi:hypothetical protein
MHAEQLNQLVARHAVFSTTAMHLQHPGDNYEGGAATGPRSTAWSTRSTDWSGCTHVRRPDQRQQRI